MSRRLLTTGALLCIGIMPLSACSLFNPPLERDESVHAIFDAEQDIVKMPLDDYLYYEHTNYEYTAFQIAMKQCFAEHGQNYTIQAECNQQVGMSKQLYDLEAQYQMPLIRKYQSQLEQERQAERDRDEKFKQYVQEHQ